MDSAASCFNPPHEVGKVRGWIDAEGGVGDTKVDSFGECRVIENFEVADDIAPPDALRAPGDFRVGAIPLGDLVLVPTAPKLAMRRFTSNRTQGRATEFSNNFALSG